MDSDYLRNTHKRSYITSDPPHPQDSNSMLTSAYLPSLRVDKHRVLPTPRPPTPPGAIGILG